MSKNLYSAINISWLHDGGERTLDFWGERAYNLSVRDGDLEEG
jgi:hypothetical protein